MAKRSNEKSAERKANHDTRPQARASFIRISPTKVRVILDTIRGKSVNEAFAILESTPKIASEPILKVVKSATANGEHNMGLSRADMFIAETYADGGPILKRVNPVSKGRAYRINKRTSHITVILDTAKEVK